jgi:hypothetical protein
MPFLKIPSLVLNCYRNPIGRGINVSFIISSSIDFEWFMSSVCRFSSGFLLYKEEVCNPGKLPTSVGTATVRWRFCWIGHFKIGWKVTDSAWWFVDKGIMRIWLGMSDHWWTMLLRNCRTNPVKIDWVYSKHRKEDRRASVIEKLQCDLLSIWHTVISFEVPIARISRKIVDNELFSSDTGSPKVRDVPVSRPILNQCFLTLVYLW